MKLSLLISFVLFTFTFLLSCVKPDVFLFLIVFLQIETFGEKQGGRMEEKVKGRKQKRQIVFRRQT